MGVESQWWVCESQWWVCESQWWVCESQWWVCESQWWVCESQWWVWCVLLAQAVSCRHFSTYRFLYAQKLQRSRPSHLPLLQQALGEELSTKLSTNTDVRCGLAAEQFHQQNTDACYQITSAILNDDPYHTSAIVLHTACCTQKNKFEELFSLGHRLVDSAPNSALSWYVVGCYYVTIGKHQSARKYLTKSLNLDSNFGPAHIAFGLSFAAEGEHDQAISAFSNAARVMRGSCLPLLYLGKEYFLTGAITTSTKFMKAAYDLASCDPLLLHEIGWVCVLDGVGVVLVG